MSTYGQVRTSLETLLVFIPKVDDDEVAVSTMELEVEFGVWGGVE